MDSKAPSQVLGGVDGSPCEMLEVVDGESSEVVTVENVVLGLGAVSSPGTHCQYP